MAPTRNEAFLSSKGIKNLSKPQEILDIFFLPSLGMEMRIVIISCTTQVKPGHSSPRGAAFLSGGR